MPCLHTADLRRGTDNVPSPDRHCYCHSGARWCLGHHVAASKGTWAPPLPQIQAAEDI